jgi:hypothetical protein
MHGKNCVAVLLQWATECSQRNVESRPIQYGGSKDGEQGVDGEKKGS